MQKPKLSAHVPITYNERKVLENIKSKRESLKYTEANIAEKLGIKENAYHRIECGDTPLKVFQLVRIVAALDCSLRSLLID